MNTVLWLHIRRRGAQWARSAENVKKPQINVNGMDMGHNDSNNVFSKNLGTYFELFTVH